MFDDIHTQILDSTHILDTSKSTEAFGSQAKLAQWQVLGRTTEFLIFY